MSFDKISSKDVKIRKKWPKNFNPATKVEKVKKKYAEADHKKAIEDALEEMEQDKYDQYE